MRYQRWYGGKLYTKAFWRRLEPDARKLALGGFKHRPPATFNELRSLIWQEQKPIWMNLRSMRSEW